MEQVIDDIILQFSVPAVIGLFRDSCLPAGFRSGGSLTDGNFDISKLVDDLLSVKDFLVIYFPLSNPQTNIITGLVLGGRSCTLVKADLAALSNSGAY